MAAAQERRPELRYLRGRCLAAGEAITYWALAEILRGAFGIGLDDPAESVAERMRTGVATTLEPLGLDPSEVALTTQALATTVGVKLGSDASPIHADELARAWPRFATAFAASGTGDLADRGPALGGAPALEMIERIATRTSGPLVILATARPEFLEGHPGFGAAGGAPPTALSLRPLTDAQGTELVERLLAVAELPASLRADILSKAEGNPFFVEEIVRRLIDEGVLVQEGDHWRATGAALTTTIPDSIYALLAARVDALSASDRRILQEAAVIGRTFWAAAVAHAIPGNGVAESLAVLERKGLVLVRPTSTLGGQEEFAFRHALVRDVAYSSLPKARRARAHAEAGDWIAELAGERSDEFVELVAYHYETAIAGEDADLAWLGDAGEREAVRAKAYRIVAWRREMWHGADTRWIARWSCTSERWPWPLTTSSGWRHTSRSAEITTSPSTVSTPWPAIAPRSTWLAEIRPRQLASRAWPVVLGAWSPCAAAHSRSCLTTSRSTTSSARGSRRSRIVASGPRCCSRARKWPCAGRSAAWRTRSASNSEWQRPRRRS